MPLYTPRIPLIGSGQTVTASAPLLDLTQTWNNVATTFTGLKLNVTDTASASGSLLMDLQVGGVSQFNISKIGSAVATGNVTAGGFAARIGTTGVIAASSVPIGFSSITSTTGTLDVLLNRDAANTLALRNGTAAQKFNVYNTYTDASNYERGVFDWAGTANTLRIGTEAAGTGTVRNIQLVAGSNSVTATVGASNLLTLNGGLTLANNLSLSAGNQILFGANARIVDSASGNLLVSTSGTGTGFGLLQFGGTTSSFPALKRSGVQLELRLADDSAFTALKVSVLKTDAVTVATLPSAASAGAGGRSFVTDANATMAAGIGTIVVGGGSNKVPVYSDGTNWLIG